MLQFSSDDSLATCKRSIIEDGEYVVGSKVTVRFNGLLEEGTVQFASDLYSAAIARERELADAPVSSEEEDTADVNQQTEPTAPPTTRHRRIPWPAPYRGVRRLRWRPSTSPQANGSIKLRRDKTRCTLTC